MNLSPSQLVPSLIALIGVVLSVLAAVLTTRHQVAGEIQKIHHQVLAVYAQHLSPARLQAYPELFSVISAAVKEIDYAKEAGRELEIEWNRIFQQVNDWDNQHGLLLAKESGDACYELRLLLAKVTRKGAGSLADLSLKNVGAKLVRLEVALREDLGVYPLGDRNPDPSNRGFTGRTFPDVGPLENMPAPPSTRATTAGV